MLAALSCAAAVLAGPARAADDLSARSNATLEEARQHAAKAKVHYDLGEFEKAAEEYIVVYRLRPLPALLFNIAQAYRQGAQYEKAKQFYRAYLRENPDPKIAASVKKALKEIDELLAKERRTREAPPSGVREDLAPAGGPAQPALAAPPPPPASAAIVAGPPPASPSQASRAAVSAAASPAPRPVPAASVSPASTSVPASALPATAVQIREAPSSA